MALTLAQAKVGMNNKVDEKVIELFQRNSKVLDIECSDKNLRACGIFNRNKTVTVGIVNRNKEATEISLDTSLFDGDIRAYEYDANNPPYNEFADLQDYTAIISKDKPIYTLKPESVTYFTTDYILKEESVYADGVEIDGGLIKWNAVEDKNHCYYRVFTSNEQDFIPSVENQIASTVATSIKSDKVLKYVKVVSVDKSGNM